MRWGRREGLKWYPGREGAGRKRERESLWDLYLHVKVNVKRQKNVTCYFLCQEFSCILSILAAILNIGDIRIEGEAHPHVGEVSVITNPNKINDGRLRERKISKRPKDPSNFV